MEKANVNLCDDCNERIAINKCNLCKIDLCKNCSKSLENTILSILICKQCKAKIGILLTNHIEIIKNHMNKSFIDILQKKEILNAIEEK